MVSVVVVLTVVQVKVAFGMGVLTHGVGVDFKTDGVLNGLKERFAGISEVQDGEDGSTANEGALLGVSDMHNGEFVLSVHL